MISRRHDRSVWGALHDVTANGERFVMARDAEITASEAEPDLINIVLNWLEELTERVPVP